MANKPKAKPDLLPFPVIAAATNGNADAINGKAALTGNQAHNPHLEL